MFPTIDVLTVAILTLSDKCLIETDLLKTGFLFEFSSFPCTFDRCLEPVLMIQQSCNGRDVNSPFHMEREVRTLFQKSELSKHYRSTSFEKLESNLIFFFFKSLPTHPNFEDHAIGNIHIFF